MGFIYHDRSNCICEPLRPARYELDRLVCPPWPVLGWEHMFCAAIGRITFERRFAADLARVDRLAICEPHGRRGCMCADPGTTLTSAHTESTAMETHNERFQMAQTSASAHQTQTAGDR